MNAKPKYRYGHLQMNPFVSACCSSIAATRCKWCLLLHQRTGLEALYSYPLTDSKTEAAPVVYSSTWGMLHVPKVCITVLLMQHSLLWLCRGPASVLRSLLQYEQRNKMYPHRKYTRREE